MIQNAFTPVAIYILSAKWMVDKGKLKSSVDVSLWMWYEQIASEFCISRFRVRYF